MTQKEKINAITLATVEKGVKMTANGFCGKTYEFISLAFGEAFNAFVKPCSGLFGARMPMAVNGIVKIGNNFYLSSNNEAICSFGEIDAKSINKVYALTTKC